MAFTGKLGTEQSQLANIITGRNALVVVGAAATFTADAVLFKTVSATFTADAVVASTGGTGSFTADAVLEATIPSAYTADSALSSTTSGTLTADAALAATGAPVTAGFAADGRFPLLVFHDNYNRSVSPGIGPTTSDSEPYVVNPSSGESAASVDGSELVVSHGAGFSRGGTWYLPDIQTGVLQFDFLTPTDLTDNAPFYGIKFKSSVTGNLSGSTRYYTPNAFVTSNGDGRWWIQVASSVLILPALLPNTWYTVKFNIPEFGISQTAIKYWKRSDPEPGTWDLTATVNASGQTSFTRNDNTQFEVWSAQADDSKLDNLYIWSSIRGSLFTTDAVLKKETLKTFTANAVIASSPHPFTANAVIKKVTSSAFTADALINIAGEITFTADAVIKGTGSGSFTGDAFFNSAFRADAVLLKASSRFFTANALLNHPQFATFSADAVLHVAPTEWAIFANARLIKPAVEVSETRFRKTRTFHVQQRRPKALDAFIPPKELQKDENDNGGTPNCLPPCPGVGGGPGSVYGSNGASIRKTVVLCSNCNVFYLSERNHLGVGDDDTVTHEGCTVDHNGTSDTYRMWVQYNALPDNVFEMRVKLKWYLDPITTLSVRVFGSVGFPSIAIGSPVPYSTTYVDQVWDTGVYLGNLSFSANAGGQIAGADHGWQWQTAPSSLIIDPKALATTTFRFELSNETDDLGAEFRASNVEIVA